MDEYIQEYFDMMFKDSTITNEEIIESMAQYFSNLEDLYYILKDRKLDSPPPILAKPPSNKKEFSESTSRTPNPEIVDLKPKILKNYEYVREYDRPIIPVLHKATQASKKQVRYRDGMVVSTKGEKYIQLKDS